MRAALLACFGACSFHANATAPSGDAPSTPNPDAPKVTVDAPPPPPIAFRQIASRDGANLGSVGVAMPMAQLAGDLNVVAIGWFKTGSVASVQDSAGNTYKVAVPQFNDGSEFAAIYYACGIAAAATNTITVAFQDTNQDPDVRVAEYSGIRATACFDVGTSGFATGTAMNSGPVTTTAAHELLFAATFQFDMATAADPGFTQRQITSFGDLVEDRVVTSAGSYAATATQNTSNAWVIQLAAFFGD